MHGKNTATSKSDYIAAMISLFKLDKTTCTKEELLHVYETTLVNENTYSNAICLVSQIYNVSPQYDLLLGTLYSPPKSPHTELSEMPKPIR